MERPTRLHNHPIVAFSRGNSCENTEMNNTLVKIVKNTESFTFAR